MKILFRITGLAAIAILASGSLYAAAVSHTERFVRDFPMEIGGSLWIDNPVGNVDVVGSDLPGVSVQVVKAVMAPDSTSLKEGREQTQILIGGDQKTRVVKTVITESRDAKWKSNVSYVVRVPHASQVHVTGNLSEHVKITNIAATVTVKNVNGDITLEQVNGAVTIDSINGDIHFITDDKPTQPVQLTTINGGIEVQVAGDSVLDWIAQSIKGDFRTNLHLERGRISGNAFRALVNSPGGPMMTTTALMGNIFLLSRGGRQEDIRSIRAAVAATQARVGPVGPAGQQNSAVVSETIQTPLVQGNFIYGTPYGNFHIGEVRGFVSLQTGAGQVTLGTVSGDCNIRSGGGPLDLGDIFGNINAHTEAGEVLVRSARKGGEVSTGGGTLRVIFSAGPLTLRNGGGDIIVNRTSGPITAETHSGDVTMSMDSNVRTQHVSAKTTKGNILLNLGPRFGAEVDATVLTTEEDAAGIHSDFAGLTVKRDQFNGKTRVRATGKIGGGGEKVELYTEDGEIQIEQQGVAH